MLASCQGSHLAFTTLCTYMHQKSHATVPQQILSSCSVSFALSNLFQRTVSYNIVLTVWRPFPSQVPHFRFPISYFLVPTLGERAYKSIHSNHKFEVVLPNISMVVMASIETKVWQFSFFSTKNKIFPIHYMFNQLNLKYERLLYISTNSALNRLNSKE